MDFEGKYIDNSSLYIFPMLAQTQGAIKRVAKASLIVFRQHEHHKKAKSWVR